MPAPKVRSLTHRRISHIGQVVGFSAGFERGIFDFNEIAGFGFSSITAPGRKRAKECQRPSERWLYPLAYTPGSPYRQQSECLLDDPLIQSDAITQGHFT